MWRKLKIPPKLFKFSRYLIYFLLWFRIWVLLWAPFDLDFSCKSHDSFEFLKLSSGFACGFCSSFYSLCDASFFLISITFFRWRGAFDSWCIFSPKLLLLAAMITIGSSQFLKAHIALKQPFQAVFHCVKLGGVHIFYECSLHDNACSKLCHI